MTRFYLQFARALASRKTRTTAVALIVAGALAIEAAPPEHLCTAIVGGSLGFSLLFAWLFFHHGLHQLPREQRGPLTLVILLVLSGLLIIQAHAVLTLAAELFQLQARRSGVTPPFDGLDAAPPEESPLLPMGALRRPDAPRHPGGDRYRPRFFWKLFRARVAFFVSCFWRPWACGSRWYSRRVASC